MKNKPENNQIIPRGSIERDDAKANGADVNPNVETDAGKNMKSAETPPTEIERYKAEIQRLEDEKTRLEREKALQQQMMFDQLQTDKSDPYSRSIMIEDLDPINRIQELKTKLKKIGLTRREGYEMHSLMNRVLDIRGERFEIEKASLSDPDELIPKTSGENRILEGIKPPPGLECRWVFDTPSMGGSDIRRFMNLGFVHLRNDGTMFCEADGEAKTPNYRDSEIVIRHAKHYGHRREPATAYLMVRASCFGEEARRQKELKKRGEIRGKVEGTINRTIGLINQLGQMSGQEGTLYGQGLKVY